MPDYPESNKNWADYPHVFVLIDESGSMSGSRHTVVSSINEYLVNLKNTLPGTAKVTVRKFDSDGFLFSGANMLNGKNPLPGAMVRIRDIFKQVSLKDVRELTLDDYVPQGGTPLYDAIGSSIEILDRAVKEIEAPVFFAIMTDGHENSSSKYNSSRIKAALEKRQAQGWTVAFMGVEIDAYAAGSSIGLGADSVVQVMRSNVGAAYTTMSDMAARKMRAAQDLNKSGATFAAYSTWNSTDVTFTEEEKKKAEE